MIKQRIIIICGLIIFSTHITYAQMPPFQDILKKSSKNKDGKSKPDTFNKAKQMQENFSQKITSINFDIEKTAKKIRNPFLSQFPEDKPKITKKPTTIVINPAPIDPYDTETEAPPTGIVSGLVWNTDLPQAILDNDVVNIGDDFNGWTITNISQDGILIESMAKKRHLIKP